jgi:AcrR family transcriptional regulator
MAGQESETASRPPERRTQAQRSARTRERLLDAALDCLAEHGWSGTTTARVAERAGVSRGAELHHFPTRQELVAAAVDHLAERRMAEFSRAVAQLPDGSDLLSAGTELLWDVVSDPSAYALLELVVAARTDPALRASLEPVAQRLDGRFAEFAREMFPEPYASDPRLVRLRKVTFLLLQGLAVSQIVNDDAAERRAVLDDITDLAKRTFASIEKETP